MSTESVSLDVARAIYPHTVRQAGRTLALDATILVVLVAAWVAFRFVGWQFGLSVFVAFGAVSVARDLAWFRHVRRVDPERAYHDMQARRDLPTAWLRTYAIWACPVLVAVRLLLLLVGI